MWRPALPLALLLALGAGGLAGPAEAAERTGEPATVVEATGPDGTALRLQAQDAASGGLCLDVTYGAAAAVDAVCPSPPRTAGGDLAPRALRQAGATVLYGAVTAGTRRLDLALSSGRTLRLRTRPGSAYGGRRAGRLRFYAVAVAGQPSVGGVTTYGANRRVRLTRDLNQLALPPIGRRWVPQSLLDEVDRPADLVVLATRVAAPTGARPGRRRTALCAGLRTDGAPGRAVCVTGPTRLDVRYAANCDSGRAVVYGVAPSLVRSATALLTDGTRRALTVRRVPASVRRAGVVLSLELAAAQPRSVSLFDAAGRQVATSNLAGGEC